VAAGDDAAASATLDEALTANPWERFYRPWTLRQRAELCARHGQPDEAHRLLAESLTVARAMEARAFLERGAEAGLAAA
jgi:hypothetical protein